jgi:hypothetical protein
MWTPLLGTGHKWTGPASIIQISNPELVYEESAANVMLDDVVTDKPFGPVVPEKDRPSTLRTS